MGGPHSITATYNGDPDLRLQLVGRTGHLNVAEAATTVTVASSADPTVVGQPVLFTATISSSASGETGTVQFDDNGVLIGSGTVSGGQATFETSSLALGTHPITAVYEGDDDFVGSSSTNTVIQTVNPASTSTDVTSNHDPGLVGQAIAYTATVAVDAPGSGTPTGSVSFSDGGSPIPTCQGLALPPGPPLSVTCSQAYDTNAGHGITATYSGDADFTTSAGTMAETVHRCPPRQLSSVTVRVDVRSERHAHRHRGPDVGDGDPRWHRHVHRQRDAARNLDVVDHRRRHIGQHAPHHVARRLRLRDRLVRWRRGLPGRARPPAPRPSR